MEEHAVYIRASKTPFRSSNVNRFLMLSVIFLRLIYILLCNLLVIAILKAKLQISSAYFGHTLLLKIKKLGKCTGEKPYLYALLK